MGVSYNGNENKIYWKCQKCGYSNNKATVSELEEYNVKCEKCDTLHDVDISISIKQVGGFMKKKCTSIKNGKYGDYCDGNWINPDCTCAKGICKYQDKEKSLDS